MKTLFLITLSITIIISPIVVYSQASSEADWKFVASTDDGSYYYDPDRIYITSTGTLTAWIRGKPDKVWYTPNNTQIFFKMEMIEFDCSSGKSKILRKLWYDADSEVIDDLKGYWDWEYVVPDSIAEAELEAVCAAKSRRSNPPKNSQPRHTPSSQSITSNSQVRLTNKDYGVDLAIVTVASANLRGGPSTSDIIVKKLQFGDALVLLDRIPTGDFYNVIDVETSIEGWIHSSLIKIKYTENKKHSPLFEARSTGTNENPYAEVTNDTGKILYLKVGETRYTISPHSTKTIYLTPGVKKFYASSPGVIPNSGEHDFERGHAYTWRFWIVTTYR